MYKAKPKCSHLSHQSYYINVAKSNSNCPRLQWDSIYDRATNSWTTWESTLRAAIFIARNNGICKFNIPDRKALCLHFCLSGHHHSTAAFLVVGYISNLNRSDFGVYSPAPHLAQKGCLAHTQLEMSIIRLSLPEPKNKENQTQFF